MTLRMIGPVTVLLLVLASPPLLGSIASADTGRDSYVSGYAAAVLEREFRLPAPSLRVQDGVITLYAGDLKGVDRAAVLEALSRIRGAVRVAIVETAPAFTAQALAPAPPPSPAAAPRLSETKEPPTGLLRRWPVVQTVDRRSPLAAFWRLLSVVSQRQETEGRCRGEFRGKLQSLSRHAPPGDVGSRGPGRGVRALRSRLGVQGPHQRRLLRRGAGRLPV